MSSTFPQPPIPQSGSLERAIGAIHGRFGSQALVRGRRLPAASAWPTGLPVIDRLTGAGGLPRGRLSLLRGQATSGKLSLALAILARSTRLLARTVVIDPRRSFDPWTLARFGADLSSLVLVQPPTPAAGGEAAISLARAGAGLILALGGLTEPALGPLESAAARSGCLVLVVGEGRDQPLAFASSLTLELERQRWIREHGLVIGLRSRARCVKNKLAAPGREADLEVNYLRAPRLPTNPSLDEAPNTPTEKPAAVSVVPEVA